MTDLGASLGMYLDISLWKQVGTARTAVTSTPSEISLTLTIPESLRNTDSSVTRTFYMLKIHDGVVSVIGTGTGTTLTGTTDEFSTYVLAYKDVKKKKASNTSDPFDPVFWGLSGITAVLGAIVVVLYRRRQNV